MHPTLDPIRPAAQAPPIRTREHSAECGSGMCHHCRDVTLVEHCFINLPYGTCFRLEQKNRKECTCLLEMADSFKDHSGVVEIR